MTVRLENQSSLRHGLPLVMTTSVRQGEKVNNLRLWVKNIGIVYQQKKNCKRCRIYLLHRESIKHLYQERVELAFEDFPVGNDRGQDYNNIKLATKEQKKGHNFDWLTEKVKRVIK